MITEERVIEYPFALSKGGSADDYIREQVKLKSGIIQPLLVIFPPGPSGLVGVRCKQGAYQLVPQRDTEWLIGDDITYPHETPVNLLSPPFTLTLEGYNSDTVYDHTIIFRFVIKALVPDYIQEIVTLLQENLPIKDGDYRLSIPDIRKEISEIKMLLSEYIIPILVSIDARGEAEKAGRLSAYSFEDLSRW